MLRLVRLRRNCRFSSTSTGISLSSSRPENTDANLPTSEHPPPQHTTESHPNPFHTHAFFRSLEGSFQTPIARTLTHATRDLLVDRLSRAQRHGLALKDLDNQAYLFRAALSELRTEMTMRLRNDSAVIVAATTATRREVDGLDAKMKEDIATLKHEIQMEIDNRRNESRAETGRRDMVMEDLTHKSTVTMGDIRTEIEQAKWDNTRKGVGMVSTFVLLTIILMEARPTPSTQYPPPAPVATGHHPGLGIELGDGDA